MIKKIVLMILLSVLLISCGKKSDPEYKTFKNEKSLIQTT